MQRAGTDSALDPGMTSLSITYIGTVDRWRPLLVPGTSYPLVLVERCGGELVGRVSVGDGQATCAVYAHECTPVGVLDLAWHDHIMTVIARHWSAT